MQIFKQDDMNLRHVYTDHVNTDMPFKNFKSFVQTIGKINLDLLYLIKTDIS